MDPMLNLKLRQIDGDYFALTIPSRIWWNRVVRLVPEDTGFEEFFMGEEWTDHNFPVYVRPGNHNVVLIKGSSGMNGYAMDPTFMAIDFDSNLVTPTPNLAKICWRPVLVPMTKDGSRIYDSFGGLSNGMKLTGGSLRINGFAQNPGGSNVILTGTLDIGDTDPMAEPLEWIYWDGLLVCNRLMGRMDITQFKENRLIQWFNF